MSLIITPGQLTRRAELYYQIAQLAAAGIGLIQALEQLERHPPARSFRKPLQLLLAKIHEGATFTDSLRATSGWLPQFDIALIEAGERSGRIDICLRVLSDYYHARAKLTKQMLSQLVYPVGLIHFAVLVFLIIVPWAGSQFHTSVPWLFLKAALVLAPLYLGTAFMVFAMQSRHGEAWRSLVESTLRYVPMLGSARRDLAIARLSLALEALINSGVNIIEAWTLAAEAAASPALKRVVATWKPAFDEGHTPADLVRQSPRFPEIFANFYASGELSGKLDESLHRLQSYYQDEGNRKLEAIAQWTPKIIYGIVAAVIAFKIVQFYTGYFHQISTITKGF
jgi:type II secretory pathway component PulF